MLRQEAQAILAHTSISGNHLPEIDAIPMSIISSYTPPNYVPLPDFALPIQNDFDEEQIRTTPAYPKAYFALKCITPVVYVGAASFLVMDFADIGTCLFESGYLTAKSIALPVGISLSTSFALNVFAVKETLKETKEIAFQGQAPSDWPKVTPSKHKAAIGFTAFITGLSLFADYFESNWFINKVATDYSDFSWMNQDEFRTIAASFVTAHGLPTETWETYKATRNLLSYEKAVYESKKIHWMSNAGAWPLTTVHALSDSVQGYISITDRLNVTSPAALYLIGTGCVLKSMGKLGFITPFSIESYEDISCYINKLYIGQQQLEPIKAVAFTASAAFSIYLAYIKMALNMSFYQAAADDLNISHPDITDPFFESLTRIMFLEDSCFGTACLYPLVAKTLDGSVKGATIVAKSTYSTLKQGFARLANSISSLTSQASEESEPFLAEELSEIISNGCTHDLIAEDLPSVPVKRESVVIDLKEEDLLGLEDDPLALPQTRFYSGNAGAPTLFASGPVQILAEDIPNPKSNSKYRCTII